MQLNSHGMSAATAMGLSGIDMALWDIRAKAEAGFRLLNEDLAPHPFVAGDGFTIADAALF